MCRNRKQTNNTLGNKLFGYAGALAVAGGVLLGASPARAESAPRGVAILNFGERHLGREFRGSRLGATFAGTLSTELVNLQCFRVVEREQIEKAFAALRIEAGGFVNPQQAAEVGRMTSARYLVYGDVENAETRREKTGPIRIKGLLRHVAQNVGVLYTKWYVRMTCKVVDLETGAVVAQWQPSTETDRLEVGNDPEARLKPMLDLLSRVARNLAPQICDALARREAIANPEAAQSTIVEVDSEAGQVYLQVKERPALRPGAVFLIYRKGKPVQGTEGQAIFFRKVAVCHARVVEVTDQCVVLEVGCLKRARWQTDKRLATQVNLECQVEVLAPPQG